MTSRTIAEWQKAAYKLSCDRGFHNCRECQGTGAAPDPSPRSADGLMDCPECNGTGRDDPFKPTRIGVDLLKFAELKHEYEARLAPGTLRTI